MRAAWLVGCCVCLTAILATGAADPGDQKPLEAADGGFSIALVPEHEMQLLISQLIDEIRWGMGGDDIRDACPLCAFLADNWYDKQWVPIVVEWTDSTDASSFDPDVWVVVGEFTFRMKDLLFLDSHGPRLDYFKLGPDQPLRAGEYILDDYVAKGDADRLAVGMIAFQRTGRLKAKKIDLLRFTADKASRPLKRP